MYRFSNFPLSKSLPFWSWNDELDKDKLVEQIRYMNDKGYGGFFMHVRAGMDTYYLGDEYLSLIRSCTEKAKRENMYAWLYDEDRWPSGSAGGIVTEKNLEYRQKNILFTEKLKAIKNGRELPVQQKIRTLTQKLLTVLNIHTP